jgi:hypothetical protein
MWSHGVEPGRTRPSARTGLRRGQVPNSLPVGVERPTPDHHARIRSLRVRIEAATRRAEARCLREVAVGRSRLLSVRLAAVDGRHSIGCEPVIEHVQAVVERLHWGGQISLDFRSWRVGSGAVSTFESSVARVPDYDDRVFWGQLMDIIRHVGNWAAWCYAARELSGRTTTGSVGGSRSSRSTNRGSGSQ